MARIVANSSFNNTNPSSWNGAITFASNRQVDVSDGFNGAILRGQGLSTNAYGLSGGNVTSYESWRGDHKVATIDGFSIAATRIADSIYGNDQAALYTRLLSGNDQIYGSSGNDVISGYDGNDYIEGRGGNDTIYGGRGNDTIVLGKGNSYVSGGEGFDIVEMPGFFQQYNKARTAEGWQFWSSSQQTNANLNTVERVGFEDGVWAFDTAGNAGQAYRLYQAAFDREPDAEGLGYWIGRLDSGNTNLAAVADSFIHSPEFIRTYGTPQTVSNGQFVDLLYVHTLGRGYDLEGYNYWVNKLNTGQTNRADLLAFFSESDENKAQTAAEIADGIWYV